MWGTRGGAPEPPGPRGSWLGGNLAAYEADRLGFLLDTRERYGGLVRFGPRTTLVHDPALASNVLRNPGGWATEEDFLQRRLTDADRPVVRDLRRALNPALRPKELTQVEGIVERRLLAALREVDLVDFDPMPVLEAAIAGAVSEIYFGPDAGQLPSMLGELLDDLARIIGNPFALPEGLGGSVRRRIAARHLAVRAVVESALRKRLDDRSQDDVARQVVVRARGHSISRIADMIVGSLLASQRVPAAGAAWTLMALADHEPFQERIRDEDGSTLDHVVLECLRLHPPTWLIQRTAVEGVALGGYTFRAGHHFLISPYVIHRDPAQFPLAGEFHPDRWISASRQRVAYLPFGAGLQACPGRHLAHRLLAVVAQTVVRRFRIERGSGVVVPDPRTTLIPDGLRLTLTAAGQVAQSPDLAAASF